MWSFQFNTDFIIIISFLKYFSPNKHKNLYKFLPRYFYIYFFTLFYSFFPNLDFILKYHAHLKKGFVNVFSCYIESTMKKVQISHKKKNAHQISLFCMSKRAEFFMLFLKHLFMRIKISFSIEISIFPSKQYLLCTLLVITVTLMSV